MARKRWAIVPLGRRSTALPGDHVRWSRAWACHSSARATGALTFICQPPAGGRAAGAVPQMPDTPVMGPVFDRDHALMALPLTSGDGGAAASMRSPRMEFFVRPRLLSTSRRRCNPIVAAVRTLRWPRHRARSAVRCATQVGPQATGNAGGGFIDEQPVPDPPSRPRNRVSGDLAVHRRGLRKDGRSILLEQGIRSHLQRRSSGDAGYNGLRQRWWSAVKQPAADTVLLLTRRSNGAG
jgi:hypothetical protein